MSEEDLCGLQVYGNMTTRGWTNPCLMDGISIIPHCLACIVRIVCIIRGYIRLRRKKSEPAVSRKIMTLPGHKYRWILSIFLFLTCIFGIAEGVLSNIMFNYRPVIHIHLPNIFLLLGTLGYILHYSFAEIYNMQSFERLSLIYWLSVVVLEVLRLTSLCQTGFRFGQVRVLVTGFIILLTGVLFILELSVWSKEVSALMFKFSG